MFHYRDILKQYGFIGLNVILLSKTENNKVDCKAIAIDIYHNYSDDQDQVIIQSGLNKADGIKTAVNTDQELSPISSKCTYDNYHESDIAQLSNQERIWTSRDCGCITVTSQFT